MNPRKPYNVLFSCLNPVEGRLIIDAESKEHALELAQKLVAERYHDVRVIDAYEVDLTKALDEQEPDHFGQKIDNIPSKETMN